MPKHISWGYKLKSYRKQTPFNVDILIQNDVSKLSETKQTKERPYNLKKVHTEWNQLENYKVHQIKVLESLLPV